MISHLTTLFYHDWILGFVLLVYTHISNNFDHFEGGLVYYFAKNNTTTVKLRTWT